LSSLEILLISFCYCVADVPPAQQARRQAAKQLTADFSD
jgi:hypothetical protein